MTNRGKRSLIDEIAAGGPLQKLFLQAAGEQQQAAARLLASLRSQAKPNAQRFADGARLHVIQGTDQSPQAELRQCGAGCSACCYTPLVEITPLEAIVAGADLANRLSDDELAALKPRLHASAVLRFTSTSSGEGPRKTRCEMLGDDGLCQIYESRPLVCAGVFSLSRDACEAACCGVALADAQVPLDRPAKAWMMGVSGGLQRAMVEAGLDGNLYELHSILLRVLETDRAAARWLAGEDIFAGCHCTDAHSAPRRRATLRIDEAQSHRPKMKSRVTKTDRAEQRGGF